VRKQWEKVYKKYATRRPTTARTPPAWLTTAPPVKLAGDVVVGPTGMAVAEPEPKPEPDPPLVIELVTVPLVIELGPLPLGAGPPVVRVIMVGEAVVVGGMNE